MSAMRKPRRSAYFNCWPNFFASGKSSTPMPAARKAAAKPQIVVQAGGVEQRNEHRARRRNLLDHVQFFHGRQQAVQAERGPNARQLLVGIQRGQIVVAAAGTDAANARQPVEKRLEDRAGVVVQPAGDGDIQADAARPGRRPRSRPRSARAAWPRRCGRSRCRPPAAPVARALLRCCRKFRPSGGFRGPVRRWPRPPWSFPRQHAPARSCRVYPAPSTAVAWPARSSRSSRPVSTCGCSGGW